ncbi:hypothetical protein Micbo1qcDRAFT_178545 [Microdochium bolleyi]|uniref:Uncharacterized protein n=1 Tax=Microdochium bolleyi TaxID=196109 RepID=A0A136ISR2_9PEZI|nr:hypothetical protein Micbo1qcDRAFT_178545 [Microdochium bolleyi]
MLSTPTILLALAATAAAIDIRAYGTTTCKGAYVSCKGASPDKCCSFGGAKMSSVKWEFIPTSWDIKCSVYKGGSGTNYCSNAARDPAASKGKTSVCLGAGNPYKGAKYVFASKKRGQGEIEELPAAEDEECQRANTLTLEDGSTFDLTDLDEPAFQKMIGVHASSVSDIPDEFLQYVSWAA